MKVCAYCGRGTEEDLVCCNGCGTEFEKPAVVDASRETTEREKEFETVTAPLEAPRLGDRRLRIFELVLVCTIAFGGSILSSTWYALPQNSGSYPASRTFSAGIFKWGNSTLHEGASLALLWYVLVRRSRTFADLGLKWSKKDLGWSILLWISASVGAFAVYGAIHSAGLTMVSRWEATERVDRHLFSGGVSVMTMVFQFVNPFFEELIVRAYLMTEVMQLTNSLTKAVILSTALQTSYHFYQGGPLAFADGSLFLIFSLFYAKTNRIMPIILAHLYLDVGGTLWVWFLPIMIDRLLKLRHRHS